MCHFCPTDEKAPTFRPGRGGKCEFLGLFFFLDFMGEDLDDVPLGTIRRNIMVVP